VIPLAFFSIVRFTIISIAKQGKVGIKYWDRLLSSIASAQAKVTIASAASNKLCGM